MMEAIVPVEVQAFAMLAKRRRAQGSLEYIMMLSAASIVILIALAMIVKLKGAVVTTVSANGSNSSVSQAISNQLSGLSKGA
jgi:type IV secretory pathway component VirB8